MPVASVSFSLSSSPFLVCSRSFLVVLTLMNERLLDFEQFIDHTNTVTNTPLCPDNPSALYRKKLKDKTEHPSCFLHQRIILRGLQIRIGIATGAAAMSFIYGSSSIAPIICTTGSTMVRAARLEAAGRPRFVHVCAAAIRKLRDEDFDFQGRDPDLYLISGSFKG